MAASIIGLILSLLMIFNGVAALRRPLSALIEYDPIGKRMVEMSGESAALRMYRIYGGACVLIGLLGLFIVAQVLAQ
jgi:hypothetical protein